MPKRPYRYYSVYNRKTNMPVFIHGTTSECCASMGVTVNTFYHYVHRNKTGKWYCKYEIFVEDREEDDE